MFLHSNGLCVVGCRTYDTDGQEKLDTCTYKGKDVNSISCIIFLYHTSHLMKISAS